MDPCPQINIIKTQWLLILQYLKNKTYLYFRSQLSPRNLLTSIWWVEAQEYKFMPNGHCDLYVTLEYIGNYKLNIKILSSMSYVNWWKYESWLCLCHEGSKLSDKFVKSMIDLCLPFTSWTDEEPGLVQVFFLQISPIGQSVPLSHRTEISPTRFGSKFQKFGPM